MDSLLYIIKVSSPAVSASSFVILNEVKNRLLAGPGDKDPSLRSG